MDQSVGHAKINLLVTNTTTYIQGKLPSVVYKELKETLGWRPEDAVFKMKHSNGHWDGIETTVCYSKKYCKCSIKKDGTHFPTGLLAKAKEVLNKFAIPYDIYDKREKYSKTFEYKISEAGEKREYQQIVINNACTKERGLIKAATGAGKTFMASGIISNLGVGPFIFYVPSIDLLTQAKNEISKFISYNGSNLKVGAIGGGEFDIQDVTIMTTQTAVKACGSEYVRYDEEEGKQEEDKENASKLEEKRKDILDLIMSSKGMICDEVQHWASETCQVISDYSMNARYRFGISATPWRDKGDDILIDACFGKLIADINASFLIKNGYLVKPDIYFVPVKQGMPTGLFNYASFYKGGIVENSVRNTYISNIATSFAEQGRSVLVLCQHVSHGKMLNSMIGGSTFLHGAHSGDERFEHLEKMKRREAGVTIATSIFDEGVDCKPLDTLILAGSGKSQTRALQRIGRVLRPYTDPMGNKKTNAIVIDFEDHCKYLLSHSKKRLKIYQTEPEFNIKYLELK